MMKFLGKTLRYVFRQGLAANLEDAKATAHQGEPHWTTDTKRLYISDADGGEAGHEMHELAMVADLVSIQNVTADRLLGRVGDAGAVQELTLGSNLSFDGTDINAVDTTYAASDFDISDLADAQNKRADWDTAYSWGDHSNTGYELQTNKGQNNGYAGLDSGGKIPAAHLPNNIMSYGGTWNANTNTPQLQDGDDPEYGAGTVYLCTVAGTTDFGNGPITFEVNDWVVYSGSIWERSINTNAVTSVNNQTGTVDIGFQHLSGAPSDVITAGDNLSWDGSTLNAVGTSTTYTAGDGLSLVGTEFSNADKGSVAVSGHESTYDHTKLHDPVTLSGQNYISLSGQAITANAVDLTSHVAGTLPIANGGTAKTSFNSGQILFGSFAQSSDLFWDNVNKRLGIGQSAPNSAIDINVAGYNTQFRIRRDDTSGGGLTWGLSPGTDHTGFSSKNCIRLIEGLGNKVSFTVDGDITTEGGGYFGGNIGVGVTSPTQKIDVDGRVRIRGGSPGIGKVLTSDADGVGSWDSVTATAAGLTGNIQYNGAGSLAADPNLHWDDANDVLDVGGDVEAERVVNTHTSNVPDGITPGIIAISGQRAAFGSSTSKQTVWEASFASFAISAINETIEMEIWGAQDGDTTYTLEFGGTTVLSRTISPFDSNEFMVKFRASQRTSFSNWIITYEWWDSENGTVRGRQQVTFNQISVWVMGLYKVSASGAYTVTREFAKTIFLQTP